MFVLVEFDLKNIRKYTKKIKFFIVRNKMPLLIRDYTWDETEKMVFITVPLKGVRAHKVDLLSSEEFIKVCMTHKSDHDIHLFP